MKKIIVSAVVLVSTFAFAQENDTIKKSNDIDEVILNKYYKKYNEKEGSSSLRLNEELIKIPQNITIITNRALEDQQVTTLSDGVLRNVAGAQRLEHWGDMYTRVNMRGSRAEAFFNGVNVTTPWGPLSEDMSYVDHIEFVKGPSGFLMSNGEPSGIYNVVTKKPTGKDFNGSARVTLGSFDMYRGETDFDSKLSEKVAFRLNLMGQNKNSFRKYEFNDRYIINPSIKVDLTNQTVLTAEYIYQKAKSSEVGSSYVYSFDGYGTKPVDYTVSDPGIAPTNINDHTANINLQHKFSSDWKLTAQLTYMNNHTLGSDIWPGMFDQATGYMIRGLYFWEASNVMKFGQVFLNGYEKTGGVSHKILAGLDLGSKKYLADWNQGGAIDLVTSPFDTNSNIYTVPSAGYPTFDGSIPLEQRANPWGTISQNYNGVYLQDELGFFEDQLRLTIAARYTNVSQQAYGAAEQKGEKITPRFGLSYSIDQNTSAYALYDQAFVPQTGLFRNGSTAKPITGNNVEVGLKRDWAGGKWNTTLSLYNISKRNAITGDPTDPSGIYSIFLGRTRVQGAEFDLKGEIVKGFNAIFNYAFTENTYTETTPSAIKGQRVPGYAKHTVNGWLNYTFTQDNLLKGFGFTFGGTFLADRSTWDWGSKDSPLEMNDYLKFDAGMSWEDSKIRLNLNVFNVFNRYLYSGSGYSFLQADGTYKGGYYYQAEAPRNWRFSIAYKF
ncbi:TonB-dependent siderophore receptor [Epilithonimonas caeni]|uniref:TonB-dependent siderophore receptor n=1 Tax=Epilithonimonas caeni TaxID=365343 RepID=UPI0003FA305C|nr:TonB-dependent siderophore receptor [Epilithonimonas caeni]